MVSHEGNVWVFRCRCPEARWVEVIGDFGRKPMRDVGDGQWELTTDLPAGLHRFHYQSSNRGTLPDWGAYGVEPDDHGGWESLVFVPGTHDTRTMNHRMSEEGYASTPVGWVRHDVLPAMYANGWMDSMAGRPAHGGLDVAETADDGDDPSEPAEPRLLDEEAWLDRPHTQNKARNWMHAATRRKKRGAS